MPRTYLTHPVTGRELTNYNGTERVTTVKAVEEMIVAQLAEMFWEWTSWKQSTMDEYSLSNAELLDYLARENDTTPRDEAIRLAPRVITRVRRWRSHTGMPTALTNNFGPFIGAIAPGTKRGEDPKIKALGYDPFEKFAEDPAGYFDGHSRIIER